MGKVFYFEIDCCKYQGILRQKSWFWSHFYCNVGRKIAIFCASESRQKRSRKRFIANKSPKIQNFFLLLQNHANVLMDQTWFVWKSMFYALQGMTKNLKERSDSTWCQNLHNFFYMLGPAVNRQPGFRRGTRRAKQRREEQPCCRLAGWLRAAASCCRLLELLSARWLRGLAVYVGTGGKPSTTWLTPDDS